MLDCQGKYAFEIEIFVSKLFVGGFKIFVSLGRVDGLGTGFPVSWADLSVFLDKLYFR